MNTRRRTPKPEDKSEDKPDNSVRIAIISTVGVILTTLITALVAPLILKAMDKTPTPSMSQVVQTQNTVSPPTVIPTAVVTVAPTTVSNEPRATDFQTCSSLCNGSNSLTSFPEKISKIYAQFNYVNFPSGAKYVRTWSLNGMEWIRYSCNWDGPAAGTEVLTLKEPQGLRSGTWEITIYINDKIILNDQLTVNGNYDYWDPAGTINACHGTVN